jgi:hypothetical protein
MDKNLTLSREQINEILGEIKKLRKDADFSGWLPSEHATCYIMSPPLYYEWEKFPGHHVCPHCGKEFGDVNVDTEELSKRNDEVFSLFSRRYANNAAMAIKTWNYEGIIETAKDINELGYDAKVEFSCLDCIKNKNYPPVIFSFRLSTQQEYTITFPIFDWFDNPKHYSIEGKSLLLWKYNVAESFLRDMSKQTDSLQIEFKVKPCGKTIKGKTLYRFVKNSFGCGRNYDWENAYPFNEILSQFAFNQIDGKDEFSSDDVAVLCIGEISETARCFFNSIENARHWHKSENGELESVALYLDLAFLSTEQKCRVWMHKLSDSTSYKGMAWKEIDDALCEVLGLSFAEEK